MSERDDIRDHDEPSRDTALRELLDRALEVKLQSEMGVDCTSDVREIIESADKISLEGKTSNVAFLDMKVLHSSSIALQNTINTVTSKLNVFNTDLFAECLLGFLHHDIAENPDADIEWNKLEKIAEESFKYAPGLSIMLGLLDQEQPARLEKCRIRRERLKTVPMKKPKEVSKLDKEETDMEERMRLITATLRTAYKKTNKPICFIKFVVNPHSFSETVENLFHVAHLVREGLANMSENDEGTPLLTPLDPDKEGGQSQNREGGHIILSIDMKTWKELIEVFEIDEPLIPPRVADTTEASNNSFNEDSHSSEHEDD